LQRSRGPYTYSASSKSCVFINEIRVSPYFVLIRASIKWRLKKRNLEYRKVCLDSSPFNQRSYPGKLILAKERKGQ